MTELDIRYVINLLRQGTIKWSGRAECLRLARIQVAEGTSSNGSLILKYYWQCYRCKKFFRDEKDMEVDHIEEIGPYNGDLHNYAQRVYCSQDNLGAICILCHQAKTSSFNARLKFKRK